MPKRCPLARENEHFSQELRQLLYGRGRNSYRIVFTVLEEQDISTVRILHIRHAYQQTIGEEPELEET
jgi:negative regulator of sigma E activity